MWRSFLDRQPEVDAYSLRLSPLPQGEGQLGGTAPIVESSPLFSLAVYRPRA
jgi:hypothetical protein